MSVLLKMEDKRRKLYEDLERVLSEAYQQSASGKGHDRHGYGKSFLDQPLFTIQERFGTGFAFGQAVKKMEEAFNMVEAGGEWKKARPDVLGAIIYIAGAIIYMDKKDGVRN